MEMLLDFLRSQFSGALGEGGLQYLPVVMTLFFLRRHLESPWLDSSVQVADCRDQYDYRLGAVRLLLTSNMSASNITGWSDT